MFRTRSMCVRQLCKLEASFSSTFILTSSTLQHSKTNEWMPLNQHRFLHQHWQTYRLMTPLSFCFGHPVRRSYASRSRQGEDKPPSDEATQLITEQYFVNKDNKNKESFQGALDIFKHNDTRGRGTVEFIDGALRNMEHFGVHKDLASYKKLMDVFPKGKYIPENRLQADFYHYPKQQECACRVLTAMRTNNLIPDEEMGDMILNIFGKYATPFKLYCRMMYWLPKLKNISPWLLPDELPNEALELAKLAISQITSVDRLTKLTVYDAEDLEQSSDKTWIVSGQSIDQKELLSQLKEKSPVYVEGAFRIWLQDQQVNYFILRAPPAPALPPMMLSDDDIDDIRLWMNGEKCKKDDVSRIPTVHEQEEGVILAVAATGSSSRDSLLSWIRFLERENPALSNLAVLFTLKSPLGPAIPVEESSQMYRR